MTAFSGTSLSLSLSLSHMHMCRSSSKKTKAAPQPIFHGAAPKKASSKPAVVKASKQQQKQKEAPKSHQRVPASKPKVGSKKGKLPAVDPFVGKLIKIHDRVYSDDPDANDYHEAVVISYDELLGVHKLAFSFNKVNENGVTLEEYDDMNLYDMSRDDWIDTGEIIDFKNLGAPVVVRSEEADAAAAMAPPPAEAEEAGAAGDATPAPATAATTPPAPETTTNGTAVVESEFFPDTALEVERAHDRQTLQDIREMICEREHLIRMALDELRVADTKHETTAVLEPSPQPAAAGKREEGTGGDGGGGEPGTEAGGEGTVPMDTEEAAPLQPQKEEKDPAPPAAEEGADAAAAGNGGAEKTSSPAKEATPGKTAVEANGVEA